MIAHIRSMDVCGYRYNYEGFYKKFIHQMFINMGRMTTTQDAHKNLVGTLSILFSLLVKSFEEEIPSFGEARHFNSFKNSFK